MNTTLPAIPQDSSKASLYQAARETLRLAQACKAEIAKYDQDSLDLNSSAGQVVVPKQQPWSEQFKPSATFREFHIQSLRGHWTDDQMKAVCEGAVPLELTFQEDQFRVKASLKETGLDRVLPFGNLAVELDKRTGTMKVDHEKEPKVEIFRLPGMPRQEATFGPEGPASVEQAGLYQRGQALENWMRTRMSDYRALDNLAVDLHPQEGVVVLANQDPIGHDSRHLLLSQLKIPSEVYLQYQPSSGEIQEFRQGFGQHQAYIYQRQPDGSETFTVNQSGALQRMEIRPDGSRFQQEFDSYTVWESTRQEVAAKSQVDPFRTFKQVAPAIAAGATLATAAAFLTPIGLVGALLVGVVGGTTLLSLNEFPSGDLKAGINYFKGDDLAKATSLFKKHKAQSNGPLVFNPEGVSRQECVNFLNHDRPKKSESYLDILCKELGDEKRPGILRLANVHDLPIFAGPQGLKVADQYEIAYSDIVGLTVAR